MTVYVFRNLGMGSRLVCQSLGDLFADPIKECSVWNYSTYYDTKSPDYKLTNKEALSILGPHIFVGDAPIFVRPQKEFRFEIELKKIEGFVGLLRGKLEREQLIRLARIVRRRREKVGKASKEILKLSIYDCIVDDEKSFELSESEASFCDQFIGRHVSYSAKRFQGQILLAHG